VCVWLLIRFINFAALDKGQPVCAEVQKDDHAAIGTFEDGTIAFLCTQRAVIGSWWMCARLTLHVDDLEERLTLSPLHLRDLVSAQQGSLFFFSLSRKWSKTFLSPGERQHPPRALRENYFCCAALFHSAVLNIPDSSDFDRFGLKARVASVSRRLCALDSAIKNVCTHTATPSPFCSLRVSITIREMRIKSGSNRHRTKLL
jgi:hypothetical protein